MKRTLLLSGSLLAMAGSLALLAPRQSRGQEGREVLLPEAEMQVAPCCASGPGRPDGEWLPELRGRTVTPPEEGPLDEATLRAVRESARARAPRGRSLDGPPDARFPASAAPGVASKFNGVHFGQSGGYTPPDAQIAAGPDHLLEAVNAVIRLTDKRGRSGRMQSAAEHFDRRADAFVFDPKVHYDPLSGRFFLVYLELDSSRKRSFLLLSVSRSSSPETLGDDDWCKYVVKTKKGPTWADYPGLGMNESWVAVSTNNFKFNGGFKRSYFWVIDKEQIVDNQASCPKISVSRIRTRRDDDGEMVFNPQVAQHYEPSGLPGSPLFALNTQFLNYSDKYVLWRIDSQSAREGERAKPRASHELVEGADYAFPPEATQKGSDKPLDAGDLRAMQQLVFRNGQLWTVHTSGCVFDDGEETYSCVRAARIEADADGATVTFQDLFGVPDHFLFWPGIGVAGNGDVVAAFHIAGRKRRLGTAYNGLRGGAARFGPLTALADSFDKVVNLGKGKCPTELPASKDLVRTGDYIGVSPDPDTDEVWLAGEFARKISGNCAWATTVARVRY